jgi:hypothetical protein
MKISFITGKIAKQQYRIILQEKKIATLEHEILCT